MAASENSKRGGIASATCRVSHSSVRLPTAKLTTAWSVCSQTPPPTIAASSIADACRVVIARAMQDPGEATVKAKRASNTQQA